MKKTLLILCGLVLFSLPFFGKGKTENPAAKVEKKASVEDWRTKYPKIIYSVVTGENEADRVKRYKPFIEYLKKELKTGVEFHVASDYAGVIEGVVAKKVHFAGFGSKSYSDAWTAAEGDVEPLVVSIDQYNSTGYHSVICVRADSSYQKLDDLKGKSFAFADPGSTSGFLIPTYYLRKSGRNPDDFFGKIGFSGSHENGVMALLNNTYEAVPTWWRNEDYSNLTRMAKKDMIKMEDIRIIWKSPLIPNGPVAAIKSLPQQMKDDMRNALITLPKKEPEVFHNMYDGQISGYQAVSHDRWLDIIKMRDEELKTRKEKAKG